MTEESPNLVALIWDELTIVLDKSDLYKIKKIDYDKNIIIIQALVKEAFLMSLILGNLIGSIFSLGRLELEVKNIQSKKIIDDTILLEFKLLSKKLRYHGTIKVVKK